MFARTLVLGVVKGLVSEEFVLCYGCESRRRSRNTFVGRNRRANFISAKLLLCNQLPILPSSLRRWIIGNQMNTEWLDLPWCSVLFQSTCSTLVIRNRTEIHTQNKEPRMIVTRKEKNLLGLWRFAQTKAYNENFGLHQNQQKIRNEGWFICIGHIKISTIRQLAPPVWEL